MVLRLIRGQDRDLCDGTQVANFLLKLEFLVESTTGSFQSTDDICGKFSETEPPSATLSPRDRCQTEPQKVLLAKVADKSFSQYVCGQTVITGVGSELWRVTLVKDSLFLRVGPIFDKPNFQGQLAADPSCGLNFSALFCELGICRHCSPS